MGRMRIKKKETVIPFRETLAYRMILLAGSVIPFIVALFVMFRTMGSGLSTPFITAGVIAVASAVAAFYNLDQLRSAKIPKQTMNRMKRR